MRFWIPANGATGAIVAQLANDFVQLRRFWLLFVHALVLARPESIADIVRLIALGTALSVITTVMPIVLLQAIPEERGSTEGIEATVSIAVKRIPGAMYVELNSYNLLYFQQPQRSTSSLVGRDLQLRAFIGDIFINNYQSSARVRVGWPMRVLKAGASIRIGDGNRYADDFRYNGIEILAIATDGSVIARAPIRLSAWGLVTNIVFYSVLVYFARLLSSFCRSCVYLCCCRCYNCGYCRTAADTACPECGSRQLYK